MFENPSKELQGKPDQEKKKEALTKAIDEALESLEHYKEMPDVELIADEDGSYSSQDPAEVEKKRPNKYRKVAIGTIANNLYLILMHLEDDAVFKGKLSIITDEIAQTDRTTKDMIDRFDALAYEIIDEAKRVRDKQ